MSFEDKVILITGASSGIGADAATHLARLGGKISLVGRNEQRLNAVAAEIINEGSPEPLVIVADITVDAERIINETIDHFGKLDVLVNNAGICRIRSFEESDMDLYDEILTTNVRSNVLLTKLAVPYLEKTKGNVINISSICGLVALKSMMFYNISKAALDQFTSCAAVELGPKGIRVNSINPGVVRTPIFDKYGVPQEVVDEFVDNSANGYLVGRIGEVADTSAAIAYLASDAASFVTGVLFRVDGGAITAGAF